MSIEIFSKGLELFADQWQAPGTIKFLASGDLDDYISFTTTDNRPLITGVGNYLVLGKDGTAGSATSADDILVGGKLEVDGVLYADSTSTFTGALTSNGGIVIGDCTTGISLTGTMTTGISFANGFTGKAIKVGSLSSDTAGSGAILTDTATKIVEINADDNGTARTSGVQGRALAARTMIYANGACEDWGIHGLSKMSGVTKTGNVSAGVVGAFETTGTCQFSTGTGNCFAAGVMGRVGTGGSVTLDSGTYAACVLAFGNNPNAYAFTGTGYVGFLATITDVGTAETFDVGLVIDDSCATTGIDIGTCTTGILISGNCTQAIHLTGTIDSGYGIFAVINQANACYAAEYIELTSSVTSGDINAIRGECIATATGTSTTSVRGVRGNAEMGASAKTALLQGILAEAKVSAGGCTATSVEILGVHFSTGATLNATDFYGMKMVLQTRGDEIIATDDVALYICNEGYAGAGREMDAAIKIVDVNVSANGFTYGIDLTGAVIGTADIRMTSGGVIASAGTIKIQASGDTDDYITFGTNAENVPTIYGTGAYLRIGDAGTTGHSLVSEDDLMVTGDFEAKGVSYFDSTLTLKDQGCNITFYAVTGYPRIGSQVNDANAFMFMVTLPVGSGTWIPVMCLGDTSSRVLDHGLFDGVTQPTIAVIEKDAKYKSSSSGTHDGIDLDELTETGAFASSVVGDIVRIISGTNVTAGWYRLKTKTDDNNVDLDRNFVTGANGQSDVVYLIYHKIGMYGAQGSCMPAKYSDFASTDFEMSAAGIFFGYNLTDNEIQVVLPDGTMKAVVCA